MQEAIGDLAAEICNGKQIYSRPIGYTLWYPTGGKLFVYLKIYFLTLKLAVLYEMEAFNLYE